MPKKNLSIALGILFVILTSNVTLAHPPSQILVTFNPETALLDIRILHGVREPRGDHYISEVRVFRNGEELILQRFLSQSSAQEQRAQYTVVDAEKGNVLEIYALCNKFGDRKVALTVE